MVRYLIARLLQSVVALLVIVFIVFWLAHLTGDPAALMVPPQATHLQFLRVSAELGLNQPFFVQFGQYIGNLLRGDMGESITLQTPVRTLIMTALPNTLELAAAAFLFACLGIPLGLFAGMRAKGSIDRVARGISLLGQSIPNFAAGIILVLVFAVKLHWTPAFGQGGVRALFCPAIALGLYPLASLTLLTRSSALEVMHKDQTLFLRAKGVSSPVLMLHTFKNASLSVVTFAGIQLGALISGSVIIESLFAWPGAGRLAIQAIDDRDFALLQGVVIAETAIFIVTMLVIDLSYIFLDPRVRRSVSYGKRAEDGEESDFGSQLSDDAVSSRIL